MEFYKKIEVKTIKNEFDMSSFKPGYYKIRQITTDDKGRKNYLHPMRFVVEEDYDHNLRKVTKAYVVLSYQHGDIKVTAEVVSENTLKEMLESLDGTIVVFDYIHMPSKA